MISGSVPRRRYRTTDVFTDRPHGGNPLAVVLDADGLSPARMQDIAAEFNYSETSFVLPPEDPAHTARVRIFTPRNEIPFAGHPNVGTAFVLAWELAGAGHGVPAQFLFEEGAGLVAVRILCRDGVVAGAELRAPEALSRRGAVAAADAAACLCLGPGDVATAVHEPLVVSVGLPYLVVELASPDALRGARPDVEAHARVLVPHGTDSVFAYVRQNGALRARMFSPLDGIVEDPATGSAAAATIALLAEQEPQAPGERDWVVVQGVEMGRPSRMEGRTVRAAGRATAVHVGGSCVMMMAGQLPP